jgi:hypothetical protein
MAVFTVTFHQRIDDYAVVQTLEATEIGIGQSITLAGLGHGLNGPHTVLAVPVYEYTGVDDEGDWLYDDNVIITNQLLFKDAGNDLERSAADPFGTLTWTETCTWIIAADVLSWLGISVATANDTAFVTVCTEAANAWAYKARKMAGYQGESLSSVPSSAVKLGTIMYAAALYRERGSVDSYASFQDMAITAPTGTMGQIMRLLGIRRSQVA